LFEINQCSSHQEARMWNEVIGKLIMPSEKASEVTLNSFTIINFGVDLLVFALFASDLFED
jgi:hypothetical protein